MQTEHFHREPVQAVFTLLVFVSVYCMYHARTPEYSWQSKQKKEQLYFVTMIGLDFYAPHPSYTNKWQEAYWV